MFMLYVILILSIDVMNVENILVDIVPRARFFLFLFDAKFTFVSGALSASPLVSGTFCEFWSVVALPPSASIARKAENVSRMGFVGRAFGENLLPL